jgi:flagellar motor switch protein FliN/FliY
LTDHINEINLAEVTAQVQTGSANLLTNNDLSLVGHVEVELSVEVGSAKIAIGELFNLKQGSVVTLQQPVDTPFKLFVKDKLIGYGKLVAVDDVLGFQITQINP